MKAVVFGFLAGWGSAIGTEVWQDYNLRRYTIIAVVFLLLMWFMLLNTPQRRKLMG